MHFLRFLTILSSLSAISDGEPLQNKRHLREGPVHSYLFQSKAKYYVHVVPDEGECDYQDNIMPMCANKNFVCRMKPGKEMAAAAPSCLAYDPSNMADNPFEIEENAIEPWGVCNATAEFRRKKGDPPVCKRDFQCLCLHGEGEECICAPSDAVDEDNGAAKCRHGTSKCSKDKYCHFLQEGGIKCGQKPYYL